MRTRKKLYIWQKYYGNSKNNYIFWEKWAEYMFFGPALSVKIWYFSIFSRYHSQPSTVPFMAHFEENKWDCKVWQYLEPTILFFTNNREKWRRKCHCQHVFECTQQKEKVTKTAIRNPISVTVCRLLSLSTTLFRNNVLQFSKRENNWFRGRKHLNFLKGKYRRRHKKCGRISGNCLLEKGISE